MAAPGAAERKEAGADGDPEAEGQEDEADADSPGGGWDWVYDEETVRQEQEESAARAAKSRSDFEATMKSAASIRGHLAKLMDDRNPYANLPLLSPPASRGAVGSRQGHATCNVQSNLEHTRNCNFVADHMTRTQERWFNLEQRRAAYREEEQRQRERVWHTLEAGEARVLAQQRELVDVQKRRAFNSAQRRSEQQKSLKETRREKDRVWEAFYNKSSAPSEFGSPGSRSSSPDRPLPSRGASAPSLGGHGNEPPEEDDIFRSTMRSHSKYAAQMDTWRQFVFENERRTEMQWRKILQGSSKADLLGENMPAPTEKFVRKKTKAEEKERPRMVLKNMSTTFELSRKTPVEREEDASRVRAAHAEMLLKRSDAASSVFERMDAAANRRMEIREQTRKHLLQHDNYEVASAEAKVRRKALQEAFLSKVERDIAEKTDRNLHSSRASDLRRLAEERARRDKEWQQTVANAKVVKASRIQAKVDAAEGGLKKMKAATDAALALREEERQRRAENDNFAEVAAEAQLRRRMADEALVARVEREIAAKAERSARALEKPSILERERAMKKERTLNGTPKATTSGASLPLPLLPEPVAMSPIRPPAPRQAELGVLEDEESGGEGEAEFLKELGERSGEWLQELRRKQKTLAAF